MRKLLISSAIIALFNIPSAWAQPDHDRGHGGGPQGGSPASQERGGPHGGPQGGGPAPEGRGGPHGGPPGGGHFEHGAGPHAESGPNPAFSRGPSGGQGGGGNSGRPVMTSNPGYNRGPVGGGNPARAPMASNPGYSRGPNGGADFHTQGTPNMAGRPGGGFNHGYAGGPRHDFRGFTDYHQNFTAPRHFHAGVYHPPAGWYPRRWVFGEFLPAAYWARDYWLIDFMDFGLPPPPYGAIWVRVGYDALLIDQDTGEIITVEYGVFY